MKENKFRLWCKDLEEIIEVNKMGFENNELWYVECIDHDKELLYFSENDDHVLMQFTGLKDKKGKEIYEGDIIQGRNRAHDLRNIKQQVLFQNGCYMFGNWNAHEYFNKHQEIEVIGNIYENPELLEEVK